jgi:hypothetical protein
MAASWQSNTTNDIGGKRQDGELDECTPLLKGRDNIRAGGYLVDSSDAAVWADEEAGKCEIPLTDKLPRGPIPRNIVGVISILLLGTYLVFLQFKFKFPRPSNPLCIPHFRLVNGGGHSVDFQTALSDIELRSSADRGISVGVFVANADTSLVLATSGNISSEFQDFGNAGWIITSYTLAMCATQSLVRL